MALDPLEKHVEDCDEWKTAHDAAHKRLELQVHDHDKSLKNGVDTFKALQSDVGMLKPKPLQVRDIFFPTAALIVTVFTIWWNVADQFSHRPTEDRVRQLMKDETEIIVYRINQLENKLMTEKNK